MYTWCSNDFISLNNFLADFYMFGSQISCLKVWHIFLHIIKTREPLHSNIFVCSWGLMADICTMLQHLLQPWQTRFFGGDSDNLFIWTLCTIKWFYTYKLFWCASVGCSRDQIILHPLPPASRLLNKPIFQKKLINKSLTCPDLSGKLFCVTSGTTVPYLLDPVPLYHTS